MRVLPQLSRLLSLPQAAAGSTRPYSTWMLDSVIHRGEGINPADGLLGVIQKASLTCLYTLKMLLIKCVLDKGPFSGGSPLRH